jgi:tRNA nucleotidyltransferase (CCA-adding enzyme)
LPDGSAGGVPEASMHFPELIPLRDELAAVAAVIGVLREAGGRPVLVGGCVRDALLGATTKDIDIEVYGLSTQAVESTLARHFEVITVGAAFGVTKLKNVPVEVSIPRRENRTGAKHTDFAIEADPTMTAHEAASRRDFTINAIAWDPASGTLVDPWGGLADLRTGVLRHVSGKFGEDALRVLRAMQFAARFGFIVAPETEAVCASLPAEHLPRERLLEEWTKLILRGKRPSLGLDFLRRCGWIRHYPELEAIIGVPQDSSWHPEGCVWTHTLHCMDAFARRRTGDDREDLIVGLAVLCHDLGKAVTTARGDDGKWHAYRHEEAGVPIAESFLRRLTNESGLIEEVLPHVRWHDVPHTLYASGARQASVRRLAMNVGRIDRLLRVELADRQGRPPIEVGDETPQGVWLREQAAALGITDARPAPILLGRHLLELGMTPGPSFAPILREAHEAQIEGAFADLEGGREWLHRRLELPDHPS